MTAFDSLRFRLTIAYATCAFAVFATSGLILAVAIFAVVTRPDGRTLTRSVRIVEAETARVPAREPLAAAQNRVIAAAATDGIEVVAIVPTVFHHGGGGPPGFIDLGNVFNLSPAFIPIRNGAVAVIPAERRRAKAATVFQVLIGLVIVPAALGAWRIALFGTDQTLRPLVVVTEELERFGSGDFAPHPLRLAQTSEIARLTTAFNGAADEVTRAFLERRSAEEQMRRFVADAGRELRTPLAVMTRSVDVVRHDDGSDAIARRVAFASVSSEIKRMRTIVESLMKLARLDGLHEREPEVVDVTAVAREAIRSLTVTAAAPIALKAAPNVLVLGEPADVYETIENVVENALTYGAGSPVDVTIAVERGWAVVRIRDGGPGILDAERERIFERFSRGTNRPDVAGAGLGLAIASQAAERLGGRVVLEATGAGGTIFAFFVPLLAESDAGP